MLKYINVDRLKLLYTLGERFPSVFSNYVVEAKFGRWEIQEIDEDHDYEWFCPNYRFVNKNNSLYK